MERNGFSIRVDHRTLQAQKEEAEQNDDTFLARLFNRVLEEYASQKFASQPLLAMKNKMLIAVAEVNKWKSVIIS